MSPKDTAVHDLRSRLVRVTFLIRLIALGYGLAAMLVHRDSAEGGPLAALLLAVMVATSHLGLQHARVRELVVRHPAIALVDVVAVSLTPFVMGVNSPLALVAHTSALLIGVLFLLRTSVPLALLLALSYTVADLTQADHTIVDGLRVPVVLLSFAALGAAIRRLAEQQLQTQRTTTLALQSAAAAQERLRLARDLHDTVAKSVQGLALTASALPRWMERDPQVAARQALSVAAAAKDAVTAARNLLTSLRLDDPARPLADVVDELAYRWEVDRGRPVERRVDDVPPLPPGHRHELVCALAEALENIERHAPDARVTVSLENRGGVVRCTVADDGPGFAPRREAEAEAEGHYGLVGMRERMESVDGTAEVRSAPGRGTRVTLDLPVPGAALPAGPDLRVDLRDGTGTSRTRQGAL